MTSIALYAIQYGTIGRAMHMKYVSASQKQCTLGHEEHPGHRQCGHEEHPGHRQGASRDVGDVRLAERRTEEGTTVRTLRLCALNGAPRPPTDRAPVRAHRALRAATKVSPLEIHFCGTQPCCFKRCS